MLTQQQLDKLETKLTAAVEAHLASGGKLTAGSFHFNLPDGEECLCPIACLTKGSPLSYEDAISYKVGFSITWNEMWELVMGFDGKGSNENAIWLLGLKLRQKYNDRITTRG